MSKTSPQNLFIISELHTVFTNCERIEDHLAVKFIVKDPKTGSQTGDIIFYKKDEREIRVFIDNFPGQKKFYQTNMPFKDYKEFFNKMSQIGLLLVWAKKPNISPLEELLRIGDPWPLVDVIEKLTDASDILLHQKDYDRMGWEDHEYCFREGRKIVELLRHQNKFNQIVES